MGWEKKCRNASSDWRASHFLLASLIVMALSITFFFAGRSIFNKIEEVAGHDLLYRFATWGGFVVENVALNIQPQESFLPIVDRVKRQLIPLSGKPLFAIDPHDISRQISNSPSVERVWVRRSWPNQIRVDVEIREPKLVLRARDAWIYVDRNGHFIAADRSLRNPSFDLPQVYGFENQLIGEIEDLNRLYTKEKFWLKDLVALIENLKTRVGLSVLSSRVKENPWSQSAIFQLDSVSKKGEEFQITFKEGDWLGRLRPLQFILSDLRTRQLDRVALNASYSGRWYVEVQEEIN